MKVTAKDVLTRHCFMATMLSLELWLGLTFGYHTSNISLKIIFAL